TDALAFQWTFVSGFQSGAVIRWEWVQPNGSIYRQFQAPVNNTSSNVCFWDAIAIAGTNAASLPGNWQVPVFYNGSLSVTDNSTITGGTTCTNAPSGLVSWWRAENSTNDSAGANHGILQNGATFTPAGEVGQAFSFDGVDDYVRVPASAT